MVCARPHLQPSGYALIIDGKSLTYALGEHQDLFLSLCSQTSCAICCRANPLQKAKVVQLVQKKNKVIGLGIGDGANDVSMIQQARVGVGIMGLEGTQAARASDFAIPEFRSGFVVYFSSCGRRVVPYVLAHLFGLPSTCCPPTSPIVCLLVWIGETENCCHCWRYTAGTRTFAMQMLYSTRSTRTPSCPSCCFSTIFMMVSVER